MPKIAQSPLFWMFAFAVAALNMRAPIVVVGPLLDAIMRDLAVGAGSASLLSTGMVICFGVLSPFAPLLAARFGLDATVALFLGAIAAGGLLRGTDHFGLMLAGTLLAGAGIAMGNVLMPSLVKRDQPQRLGAMMGLYTMVMGVGGTLAAVTAVPLMTLTGHWSAPLLAWAAVAAISCGLWCALAWQRRAAPGEAESYSLTALLGHPGAWMITLYMGIQSLGFYTVQAWLPAVAMDAGISEARAGVMLSAINLLTIPASFVAAQLAARWRRQSLLAVAMTALIVAGVMGLLLAPTAVPMLWALLLGVGQGGCFSLVLTLIVLRTDRPEHAATLSAMAQSIGYTIAAFGPWLFGVLHEMTGTWQLALRGLLGLLVVQMVLGYGIGRGGVIAPRR